MQIYVKYTIILTDTSYYSSLQNTTLEYQEEIILRGAKILTYQDFINHAKEVVNSQPFPPRYNPDDYKGKFFNCYAYALQLCMDCKNYQISPGFMSKHIKNSRFEIPCTREYIIKNFQKDCEALGLQVLSSSISESIRANEYKIAVYFIEDFGFHFARQDSNGKWSEKPGWINEIRIVESVTENEFGYKLIGIFRVSKKI